MPRTGPFGDLSEVDKDTELEMLRVKVAFLEQEVVSLKAQNERILKNNSDFTTQIARLNGKLRSITLNQGPSSAQNFVCSFVPNVGTSSNETTPGLPTAVPNTVFAPTNIGMIPAVSGIYENPNQVSRTLTHVQRQLGLLGPAPGPLVEDPRELQRSVRKKGNPRGKLFIVLLAVSVSYM